jgi:hypothetical protein
MSLYCRRRRWTTAENVFPPLLAAVSHLLASSEIEESFGNTQGMSLFTMIVGDVGSGKTPAMSAVRDALLAIDDALATDENEKKYLTGK